MIVYVPLGAFLFALGGTTWKGWRRWIFPMATLVFLAVSGIALWKALLACGLLAGVLHLGYGESHPWVPDKLMVALSYTIPSLVIGSSLWNLILPPSFFLMFLGSNYVFQKSFPWKIVELMAGAMLAVTFVCSAGNQW